MAETGEKYIFHEIEYRIEVLERNDGKKMHYPQIFVPTSVTRPYFFGMFGQHVYVYEWLYFEQDLKASRDNDLIYEICYNFRASKNPGLRVNFETAEEATAVIEKYREDLSKKRKATAEYMELRDKELEAAKIKQTTYLKVA